MKISIIIPTFNEEKNIGTLIDFLLNNKGDGDIEIIVVDGGSKDRTTEVATYKKVKTFISDVKGRANQMNFGASVAKGDILYFVHADTLPPNSYTSCIKKSVLEGYTSGCCAYKFDSENWLLKMNSFFTQFNGFYAGGGDQTLFVTKPIFEKLGGFNKNYVIMEDFEFTKRLKSITKFKVIKSKAIVSARKYEQNSYLKVNTVNLIAMIMFWLKYSPQKIKSTYTSLIKY